MSRQHRCITLARDVLVVVLLLLLLLFIVTFILLLLLLVVVVVVLGGMRGRKPNPCHEKPRSEKSRVKRVKNVGIPLFLGETQPLATFVGLS